MGIDPGLAEVPPALLPSLPADIPALHDAPESKISSINQTERLHNGGKKLDGLDCIIHKIPAAKKSLDET